MNLDEFIKPTAIMVTGLEIGWHKLYYNCKQLNLNRQSQNYSQIVRLTLLHKLQFIVLNVVTALSLLEVCYYCFNFV